MQVLCRLPTWSKITNTLWECDTSDLLSAESPCFRELFNIPIPGQQLAQKRPGSLLYSIMALCSVLTPSECLSPDGTTCLLLRCPSVLIDALIEAVNANYDLNLMDGAFWTTFFSITLRVLTVIMHASSLPLSESEELPDVSQTNENDAISAGGVVDEAETLMVTTLEEPLASEVDLQADAVVGSDSAPLIECAVEALGDGSAFVSHAIGPSVTQPLRALLTSRSPSGSFGCSDEDKPGQSIECGLKLKPVLEITTLCKLLDFCIAQAGSIAARLADTTHAPVTVCWSATVDTMTDAASDQLLLEVLRRHSGFWS